MGRRALRKIDPTLDLSRHLKTFDDLPNPWDAALLFGREAPLEVEVGCGKGLFIRSAATLRPNHNFLGIEVAAKYARFCAAGLAKRELDSAVIVHGDGIRVFRTLLPTRSIAAVHVYFPDPWWKARHHKRRVMNESFIADVARVLVLGGRFHFWTDVREYFDESLALLGVESRLAGPFNVAEQPAEHDLDYRTHFERRTRLAGAPICRAEFEKLGERK